MTDPFHLTPAEPGQLPWLEAQNFFEHIKWATMLLKK
jgi:hypothetical protein